MAANKFATMLHRNTNKLTLILVYAVLEWTLIVLLLLNSLFSYLIIKFADYFGLKKPCLWCSRLDHIFEPGKSKNSYRDLICEAHAEEISELGYCSNHQKLAESRDMCEDCLSSSSSSSHEWSNKFALFPWMKKIGLIQGGDLVDDEKEVVEESFECSCCGVNLKDKFYPPCILIKPSWGVLDYAQRENLVDQAGIDAQTDDGDHIWDRSGSDFVTENHEEEEEEEEEEEQGSEENRGNQVVSDAEKSSGEDESLCREILADENEQLNEVVERDEEEKEEAEAEDDDEEEEEEKKVKEEEEAIEEYNLEFFLGDQPCELSTVQKTSNKDVPAQHLEFYIGQEDCTLIPVEFTSKKTLTQLDYKVEEQGKSSNEEDLILDFDMSGVAQVEQITETWLSTENTLELLTPNECIQSADFVESRRNSFAFHGDQVDIEIREFQKVLIAQGTQTLSEDEDCENDNGQAMSGEESDLYVNQAFEDENNMQSYEIDGEVSIGTDIPDHEPNDEIQSKEDPSSSSVNLHCDDNHDFEQAEEGLELVEFKTLSVETNYKDTSNHLFFGLELNDIDEERVPDTPSSMDSLHQLHKKLMLLERRESGAEESLDGSVMSDIEGGGDGILTMEKLKSVLKSERKALNVLYAELEEERSASAVAASQTMAMINRLQEEKAAMQMEALQYQRMMEEQSEYDQEALQLLNDLMTKRERENQELEKELELYRKRIQDYEAKERMMVRRMKEGSITRSRTSSVSCSNAEDSDELSIDLNHEAKEEDCVEGHEDTSSNQNTPVEAVLYLEDSLAGFEEERLSILDQLRVLEEKLFTLQSDEEDMHFEDIKPIELLYKENGNGYHDSLDLSNGVITNGHAKEMNGKHHHHQERRIMGAKAKRLLPFFDATEEENEDEVLNGNDEGFDFVMMQSSEFERESKKVAIEEEVDHVYERLQALEADREFLKHCISSLKKGDKGLHLLQEILQHLRDLRSVEIRVRNMGDVSL